MLATELGPFTCLLFLELVEAPALVVQMIPLPDVVGLLLDVLPPSRQKHMTCQLSGGFLRPPNSYRGVFCVPQVALGRYFAATK